MAKNEASARVLWERFLTLTQETEKFLDGNDIDMAMELMRQSLETYKSIEALPVDDFKPTPAGQELLAELKPVYKRTQLKAQSWLNRSRRQNQAVKTYTTLGGITPSGHIFNKKS